MPEAPKRKWGENDPDIEPFYLGATDEHGHSGKVGDLRVSPWLLDAMKALSHEIPAYNGKLISVARDCLTIGVKRRNDQVGDPETKAQINRTLQLHLDTETQAWEQKQFLAMKNYAESCEMTLRIHSDAGNWMRVSAHLEQMKKRLSEGMLLEPHKKTIEKLVKDFTARLKKAKPA